MELVWQVEKDSVLIQLETKVQGLEEAKHQNENLCCKSRQDMDFVKIEIMSLVAKVEMAENHALVLI